MPPPEPPALVLLPVTEVPLRLAVPPLNTNRAPPSTAELEPIEPPDMFRVPLVPSAMAPPTFDAALPLIVTFVAVTLGLSVLSSGLAQIAPPWNARFGEAGLLVNVVSLSVATPVLEMPVPSTPRFPVK